MPRENISIVMSFWRQLGHCGNVRIYTHPEYSRQRSHGSCVHHKFHHMVVIRVHREEVENVENIIENL